MIANTLNSIDQISTEHLLAGLGFLAAFVAAGLLPVVWYLASRPIPTTDFIQPNNRTMRGFTLVELAIVIVIAGILAAVAIPIYQGLINDSKWSEGKSSAGTVRQSCDVLMARYSNKMPNDTNVIPASGFNMSNGTAQTGIKLQNAFDNLRYFVASDFVVTYTAAGSVYTVTVTSSTSSVADAPTGGPYKLDRGGDETGP